MAVSRHRPVKLHWSDPPRLAGGSGRGGQRAAATPEKGLLRDELLASGARGELEEREQRARGRASSFDTLPSPVARHPVPALVWHYHGPRPGTPGRRPPRRPFSRRPQAPHPPAPRRRRVRLPRPLPAGRLTPHSSRASGSWHPAAPRPAVHGPAALCPSGPCPAAHGVQRLRAQRPMAQRPTVTAASPSGLPWPHIMRLAASAVAP